MGGRRWFILAGVVLAGVLVVGLVLLASRTPGVVHEAGLANPTRSGESGGTDVELPTPPNPSSLSVPSDIGDVRESEMEAGTSRVTDRGGNEASASSPPSPPPQPPPSPPVQPSPEPCTVSIYAGPIPGVPNIRVVVTAAPTVDALWASITERGKTLRGVVALAGGRGEQVVEGVSQAAKVSIFSDPAMAEPTLSCATF